MSLQLILGSSGSGKSHYIYHKIIEESIENPHRDYMVIVPEQFTMQTQKELVQMHPGGGILNIDVLSFQRLAYRIFEEVGGDTREFLEEAGKTLVLEKVVQQNQKSLRYLGSQMSKPGYIQEMKSLISELMQYDIGKTEMEEILANCGDRTLLEQKLRDVQLLYDKFREYLSERYITGEEVLEVLCGKLHQSEKIRNSTLILDGFTGFTPVQYKVLRELLILCPTIYVTVTLGEGEDPYYKGKLYHLFSMSKEMICSLRNLCREMKVEMAEPRWIPAGEDSRFGNSPALHHLEGNLFRSRKKAYEGEMRDIHLFTGMNPLGELTGVSRHIARLVREEGYRYGDIAVITGDLETYGNYAGQVFDKAEIPYFLDHKHSALMNPFVEYIRSTLDIMLQNFSYESMFRHLRCGFAGVTAEEIDRLENYVIALGIRGLRAWEERWVRLYQGMDPGDILELNEIRERIMSTLSPLAENFKRRGNTVREDTQALYDYIVSNHIQEQLKVHELTFSRTGDLAMEKEYAQIYGIIMELFDKLVEILGEEKITQREFVQLMEAGLSEVTVGIIPPSTDQVLIGDMERTRLKDIKALFFVGVNDGIIPKNSGSGGILSEVDREYFAQEGIILAPTPREAMYMQRFYLYLNLTKPSERLYLSYAQTDARGEPLGPAYLIGTIHQLFPGIQIEYSESDTMEEFQRPQDAMEALVEGMRSCALGSPHAKWMELYNWFASREEYRDFLERLVQAAFYEKPRDRISQSVAKALYGEISPHSATRLEKFAACAFAHFLRYGLKLQERQTYEFTPMDMGNVMHNALEYFSREMEKQGITWKTLSEEDREQLGKASVQAVVDDYGNTILHSSARNEYMIRRVERMLERSTWALQQQVFRGEFIPEGVEVAIGGGRIDRLDVCETEDKVYVKVIDYKTGNTSFDLVKVYHGLQLQLMVYLDGALELERKKHPEKEVEPAGVFYYNIKDPMIQAEIDADVESVEKKILKELTMNGLVTGDKTVLDRMDETLDSIPVAFNKDGSFSKASKVANKIQFERLSIYVNEKIDEIKRQIEAGEAEVAPYRLDKMEGCTYCPYRSVCGFDGKVPGFEYRRMKKLKDEEVWNEIMEGGV